MDYQAILPFLPLLGSAISLAAGLGGVVIGSRLTEARESRKAKDERERKAIHLTTAVGPSLEIFAMKCLQVAHDNGYDPFQPEEHDLPTPQVKAPKFSPSDFNVDWTSVSPKLMNFVLEIPYKLHLISHDLSEDSQDADPLRAVYFENRRFRFAELGVQAAELAQRLRVETRHIEFEPARSVPLLKELRDARDALLEQVENRRLVQLKQYEELAESHPDAGALPAG